MPIWYVDVPTLSKLLLTVAVCGLFRLLCSDTYAQDPRAPCPNLLSNSYVGVHIGYIDYPDSQLKNGFQSESVSVPHLAVQVLLFDQEFNKE
jgi:hypothetical protein